MFKPSREFLLTVLRQCFFEDQVFVIRVSCFLCYAVPPSLVITCWEKAFLLAVLWFVFSSVLSIYNKVFWIVCAY